MGTDNPETALGLVTRVRGRRSGNSRGRAGSAGPQTLLPAHISVLWPSCPRAGLTPQGRRGFPLLLTGWTWLWSCGGHGSPEGQKPSVFHRCPGDTCACVSEDLGGFCAQGGCRRLASAGHCRVWGVSRVLFPLASACPGGGGVVSGVTGWLTRGSVGGLCATRQCPEHWGVCTV